MLQPVDWDVTTKQQVEKRTNTTRSESTQGMFPEQVTQQREEHWLMCLGPACSPPSIQPFEPW